MYSSDVGTESGGICVLGHGNKDLDVVRGTSAFELCFGLSYENV